MDTAKSQERQNNMKREPNQITKLYFILLINYTKGNAAHEGVERNIGCCKKAASEELHMKLQSFRLAVTHKNNLKKRLGFTII